jgi:AraC-like DNA-binding protein
LTADFHEIRMRTGANPSVPQQGRTGRSASAMQNPGFSVEIVSSLPCDGLDTAPDAAGAVVAPSADIRKRLWRFLPSEGVTARDYCSSMEVISLWLTDGPQLEVRLGSTKFSVMPRRGLLDYCPVTPVDLFRRAPGTACWLIISLSPEFAAYAHQDFEMSGARLRPEFQFSDTRLQHMLGGMAQRLFAPSYPVTQLSLESLAIAAVARLFDRQCEGTRRMRATQSLPRASRKLLVEYIRSRIDHDLELAELAGLVGYSCAQFLRVFRSTFGVTPHQYLLGERIECAKQMMQGLDINLTQLAQHLGFASHAHFSTTFKMRTGMTPTAFRRACRVTVWGRTCT